MEIRRFVKDGEIWVKVGGKEIKAYKKNGEISDELYSILIENQGNITVVDESDKKLDEMREAEVESASKVLVEKKNQNWFKKNWRGFVALTLAVVLLASVIVLICKSCKSDTKKKYDYDAFYNETVISTKAKFEEVGYPITEAQARDLIYGINAEEAIETGHINKDTNDVELFDNCLAYAGKILSQHCDALEKYLYSDECGKGEVKDISVAALVAQDYNDYDYQVIAKLESYQKELEKMILREKGVYSAIIRDEDKARFDQIMLEIRNFWTCSGGIKIQDGDKTVNVTLHDIGEGDKIMAVSTIIYKITYLTTNINESIIYTDTAGNDVVLHVKDIIKTLEEAPAIYDTAELSNKLAHAANGGVSSECEEKGKVKTK